MSSARGRTLRCFEYEITGEDYFQALNGGDNINQSWKEGRTEQEDESNSTLGAIGELKTPQLIRDVYSGRAELEDPISGKWDKTLHTPTGSEHRLEIKTRDAQQLKKVNIDPADADLMASRHGELYADRYILAIVDNWDTIEFVGYATREQVRRAERQQIREQRPKVVDRSELKSFPRF